MKIQFLGAAGEVTGSRHLLEVNLAGSAHHFLVDYGMFQGGREASNKNLEPLPIAAKDLDCVVLTHAHIDHSGLLPRLCAQGFTGPIYCTKASYELLKILLPDSAHLQFADLERAERKAKLGKWHGDMPVVLYSREEVEQALTLDGFVLEGNALKVMRSKTAVIPVNPSLLPQSEADVERCSRTVYVANLDPVLPAAEVRATFEKMCGQVANMHQQLNNRCDAQVAFIEFTEASSAMTALECCGTLIGQRQVRVSPSKTPLKVSPKTARRSRAGDNGGNREARGGAETGVGEAGTWVQDVGDVEDVEGRPSPVDGAAGVGRSVRGDADSDEGDLVVGGGDEEAGGSGDTSPNVVAESSLDDETTILAAAPVHKLALDDSGSTETAVA